MIPEDSTLEELVDSFHRSFGWRWHWILCRLGIHSWRKEWQLRMVGYYIDQDCYYCRAIYRKYDSYKGWIKTNNKENEFVLVQHIKTFLSRCFGNRK